MLLEAAVNGGDRLVTFNVRQLAAAAAEFGIRARRSSETWKSKRNVALRLESPPSSGLRVAFRCRSDI